VTTSRKIVAMPPSNRMADYAAARQAMRSWLVSGEPKISLDLSALSFDEAMDIVGRLEAADRWVREREAQQAGADL